MNAPGSKGIEIRNKFDRVIAANTDFEQLKKIGNALGGEAAGIERNPSEIASFCFAPITSVDVIVERSFSALNYLLSDCRHCFSADTLKKHLIVAVNAKK